MTVNAGTSIPVFDAFVAQQLLPNLRPGDIVVMDNLSAHKNTRILQRIHEVGCTVSSPHLTRLSSIPSKRPGRRSEISSVVSQRFAVKLLIMPLHVRWRTFHFPTSVAGSRMQDFSSSLQNESSPGNLSGLPVQLQRSPGQRHESQVARDLLEYAQGQFFIADAGCEMRFG